MGGAGFKKYPSTSRVLDNPARVHYSDTVGHPGNDSEIMSDQDQGHLAASLFPLQQLEQLSLDRHIECRLGWARLRSGFRVLEQGRPPLRPFDEAARELMRVLAEPPRRRGLRPLRVRRVPVAPLAAARPWASIASVI